MKRLTSVDICRGIAVLCMLAADIPVITNVGYIQFFGGILAAPFFIFIAGVSYELFVISRQEKYKETLARNIETFWKAIILVGITQSILLIGVILFPSKFSLEFNSTVFVVIAAGYLLSIFIPGRWIYQIPFIILPFVISFYGNNSVPEMLSFLFSPPFPIFPCIGYFFAGRFILTFYKENNDIEMKNRKILVISVSVAAITGSLFYLFHFGYKRTSVLGFLLIVGTMIGILSLFSIIKNNTNKYDIFISPVEQIGRIAFSAYYGFYALELVVFPYLNRVLIINFDPAIQILTYYLSIVILLMLFSAIEKAWRNYDYTFGVEWIMRRGSALLTKRTLTLCEKAEFLEKS